MRKYLLLLLLLFLLLPINADSRYKYRLMLRDRQGAQLHLRDKGLRPLSPTDSTDYGLSPLYISKLKNMGFEICTSSRWMNTVVVGTDEELSDDYFLSSGFVDSMLLVWNNPYRSELPRRMKSEPAVASDDEITPQLQLSINNIDKMHTAGYTGQGITIAVIDGGFAGTDTLAMINSNVSGGKSMVESNESVYQHSSHGTHVLSTISASEKSGMKGSAPDARFWLLRSEIDDVEQAVEEDYWVAAAEYADSLGVDIISSSLGYCCFDSASMDHYWSELGQESAFISQAASIAARKGILVVVSAGNEANHVWKKITFPSDSPSVLCVGAAKASSLSAATFTSIGWVEEGSVKPNVAASGSPVYIITPQGKLDTGSGTSYAAPITAGASACLMQALRAHNNGSVNVDDNFTLMDYIQKNGSLYSSPTDQLGYGLPDYYNAYCEITGKSGVSDTFSESELTIHSLADGLWQVDGLAEECRFTVYSITGECVSRGITQAQINLTHLVEGVYIIRIKNATFKIIIC